MSITKNISDFTTLKINYLTDEMYEDALENGEINEGELYFTPDEGNNIAGTGTSGSIAKFNGTNSITNGPALGSSTSTYLRNDGTWDTPVGTVTTATTSGSGNAVTAITASNGALTVTKGTTFQTNIVKLTITLAVASWSSSSQSVTATGVTASNTVIISPAPTSIDDYAAAGIKCTAQAANSLTFTCATTPIVAISVNVVAIN